RTTGLLPQHQPVTQLHRRLRSSPPQPVWIPPRRTPHLGNAVAHADLPLAVVDVAVMPPAQRHAVARLGRPAVCGGNDMVDLAPVRRNGAAGNDTRAVARDDGPPLGGVEDAP